MIEEGTATSRGHDEDTAELVTSCTIYQPIGAYQVPMANPHLYARLKEKTAMAKPIKPVLLLALLLTLSGCAAPVGVTVWGDVLAGAIGDAIDPLVQPQVDRLLVKAHIANVDPGGTSAVAPGPSQS